MVKNKYVNDKNLQIAMSEYNENNSTIGQIVQTQNSTYVGRISQVYDNEHGSGEQVYAVILLSCPIYVIL